MRGRELDVRPLEADLSVGPQIAADDLPELHRLGFRSLICNRPDGEEAGQPSFGEIEAAAREAGIEARHVPVVAPIPDAAVAEFDGALGALAGPAFAYCRTGTRSAALWALARAGTLGADTALHRAAAAGYDLSDLAPRVAEAEDSGRAPGGAEA